MTNLREGAIVVSLIDALSQRGSFCGETHVQKGTYLLRELTGVPLESSFTLYLYGPYSFGLHALLNELRSEELIKLEPRAMGSTWRPGDRFELLKSRFPRTIDRARAQIEYVADKIAKLTVVELEPLATALWIARTKTGMSRSERANVLHKIKPHIDAAEARTSVDTVEAWEIEVRNLGLSSQRK